MLQHKKILLCVTGGIAVYKSVALVSKLVQAGASVKVIMTKSAMEFVQPLSFQVMSRHDVYYDTFDEKDSKVIAHIDLADWADLVLVAPATANTIAKMAHGLADDMVTTTLLATTAPVWVAPAMNVHMYDHPAFKRNIAQLAEDGVSFIEPSEGFLACGYVGKGRLEEPEKIVELIDKHFGEEQKPLAGKNIIVTAGPTRERIDPVRYVSNFSSGKMGYAMAEAAAKLGAQTTLISGPVELPVPAGVEIVRVESAKEMLEALEDRFDVADWVIKSAAVADYKPSTIHPTKVKKQPGNTTLEMERTADILSTLGNKKKHQLLIGFAAETNNVATYAQEKLVKKNADYILANDVSEEGSGFGTDTNRITLFSKSGSVVEFPHKQKQQLAVDIMLKIVELERGME